MAAITAENALLDISIMDAQVKNMGFSEVFTELSNKGVPTEILTRLEPLWNTTKIIANDIIQIGKIIISKILEFIRENSGLAIGIAIGAALSYLLGRIPIFGALLQDLTGEILPVLFGLVGVGEEEQKDLMESAIILVKKFFKLFADIFNAVSEYWETR